MAKRRQKTPKWEGPLQGIIGLLMTATTEVNFENETDKAAVNVMQYPISLMSCMLHCW